jgi:chromosome segregation and condensation protein ScpB
LLSGDRQRIDGLLGDHGLNRGLSLDEPAPTDLGAQHLDCVAVIGVGLHQDAQRVAEEPQRRRRLLTAALVALFASRRGAREETADLLAPVTREVLARIVGKGCNLEALIEDIRAELVDRPYELVAVAGGWQHRTRKDYADAIRVAAGVEDRALELSKLETLVLTAIAYFQPVTRRELGDLLGREVSRDMLADLRSVGLIANGPKSPRAGAPNSYVTTVEF